jgi:outer membrane protein assembly factor BamB
VFEHDDLDGATLPEVETTESEAAHHGVAIVLEDGTLLSTIGTEEERTGVRALDEDGEELARSEACPNVHGEGAVQDEVAVFGCTDGALVYQDGAFTKIDAPTEYGRTGNLFTTEDSSVAVGDYNDDPDSEGYLLDQVALIDAASGEYRVADMPEGVGFTFRDIARGPGDEAVILGSDGALHTFDEQTGEPIDTFDVIDAWEGPTEWQDAHPALKVAGDVAYVTDPTERKIHAVDLTTGWHRASRPSVGRGSTDRRSPHRDRSGRPEAGDRRTVPEAVATVEPAVLRRRGLEVRVLREGVDPAQRVVEQEPADPLTSGRGSDTDLG